MSTKIHHDEHLNNLDDDQVKEEEEGEGNEAGDDAVGDADIQHRVLHLLPHLRLLNQNTVICPLKDNFLVIWEVLICRLNFYLQSHLTQSNLCKLWYVVQFK